MPRLRFPIILDELGSAATEYTLIAGAVGIVIVSAMGTIGEALLAWLQTLADAL